MRDPRTALIKAGKSLTIDTGVSLPSSFTIMNESIARNDGAPNKFMHKCKTIRDLLINKTIYIPGHGEILPENLTYKFNSTLGNCFDKKVEIWRDDKLNDDTEVVRRTFIVKQITR